MRPLRSLVVLGVLLTVECCRPPVLPIFEPIPILCPGTPYAEQSSDPCDPRPALDFDSRFAFDPMRNP